MGEVGGGLEFDFAVFGVHFCGFARRLSGGNSARGGVRRARRRMVGLASLIVLSSAWECFQVVALGPLSRLSSGYSVVC